jgi:hypothetical protein
MDGTISPSSPAPASPTPPPAAPASNGAAPPPAAPPAAPARPEWLPEKFYDATAGAPRVEDLAKSYAKLEAERPKLKETLTTEIKTAFETERRKAAPEKPEGYKVALPEGDAAKPYSHVVILDKPPGADFQPEAGKKYAVLKQDSKLLKAAAALAHKHAIPQAEFSSFVAEFADEIGFSPMTQEQAAEARKAVYAQLGEQGEARVQHVGKQLTALVGEKHAQAFDAVVESPAQVEAIEALLEKMGQAKFSAGAAPVHAVKSEAELKQMVGDERFLTDPVYRKQVEDEFKRAYPGKGNRP